MPRLLRLMCLTLACAFMASMVLHGRADASHQADHMAEAAEHPGVEIHAHSVPDSPEDAKDSIPGHHHHNGGDGHSFAVLDKAGMVVAVSGARAAPAWLQDNLLNGLSGSGPDQPPKRTLTVI